MDHFKARLADCLTRHRAITDGGLLIHAGRGWGILAYPNAEKYYSNIFSERDREDSNPVVDIYDISRARKQTDVSAEMLDEFLNQFEAWLDKNEH